MKHKNRQVIAWITVRHGKVPARRKVVCGVIPKTYRLKGKEMYVVKERIREEYGKTARVLTAERVEEIVRAMQFAAALS